MKYSRKNRFDEPIYTVYKKLLSKFVYSWVSFTLSIMPDIEVMSSAQMSFIKHSLNLLV